jgi:hypothetical protein
MALSTLAGSTPLVTHACRSTSLATSTLCTDSLASRTSADKISSDLHLPDRTSAKKEEHKAGGMEGTSSVCGDDTGLSGSSHSI